MTGMTAKTPMLSVSLLNFAATDPGAWEPLLQRAVAAEAAGIDRVVVSDHVVFGENLEAYGRPELGGTVGGKQPTGPDGHWLEPMTLLSVLCGRTSRLRLCTGILIAALRRPVVLAKAAATLDVLSGGRLDLGVGVGWQREEYEAAGLDFDGRGALLDETLAVCQALWRESSASLRSEHLAFEAIHCMPKPVQPGGVPVWISGTVNRRVIDRIVRFGSGWIPWGPDAADPVPGLGRIRDAMAAAGRNADDLEVRGTLRVAKDAGARPDPDRTMEPVPAMVDAGITDFSLALRLPEDPGETGDLLAPLAERFRQATGRLA